jgi:hypothetical protein
MCFTLLSAPLLMLSRGRTVLMVSGLFVALSAKRSPCVCSQEVHQWIETYSHDDIDVVNK